MAGINLGTLSATIEVDGVNKAQRELKVLSGSFGNAGKSMTDAFKGGMNMSNLLSGAVGGLTAAFATFAIDGLKQAAAAMLDFAKKGVEVASSLEEVENVVVTTFGEDNKVAQWAKTSAAAFNLSELEAKRFASTMGAIMTPSGLGQDTIEDMSMTLTQLSGDLGSFWNKDSEEAFNALRSALTGETEGMKQFGVVMSVANLESYALAQGMDKSWQSMNEAEKTLLRYNYILENTTLAQGDASKTAGSFANAQKQMSLSIENAAASLGQGIMPMIGEMMGAFGEFLEENKAVITFIGDVLGTVLSTLSTFIDIVLAAFGPVFDLLNMVASALSAVLKPLNELRIKFGNLFDEMDNGSEKAKDAVEYNLKSMEESTGNHYDTVEGMAAEHNSTMEELSKESQGYLQKELSDYEKKLREQYDETTRSGRLAIEKRLEHKKKALEEEYKMEEDYNKRIAKLREEGNYKSYNGSVSKYANGTLSARGGWSLVGEHGPELMYVPSKSKVINSTQTSQVTGGSAMNFYGGITVQANNVKEFMEELQIATRRGVFA